MSANKELIKEILKRDADNIILIDDLIRNLSLEHAFIYGAFLRERFSGNDTDKLTGNKINVLSRDESDFEIKLITHYKKLYQMLDELVEYGVLAIAVQKKSAGLSQYKLGRKLYDLAKDKYVVCNLIWIEMYDCLGAAIIAKLLDLRLTATPGDFTLGTSTVARIKAKLAKMKGDGLISLSKKNSGVTVTLDKEKLDREVYLRLLLVDSKSRRAYDLDEREMRRQDWEASQAKREVDDEPDNDCEEYANEPNVLGDIELIRITSAAPVRLLLDDSIVVEMSFQGKSRTA